MPQPPPLLNTQTNDGTVSLHYPNGQQAVLIANVYGYSIDNNANNTPSTQVNFRDDNSSVNGSIGTNHVNSALTRQNYKNSYTTIIYDVSSARKLLLAKGITSMSAKQKSTTTTTTANANEIDKMLADAKQLKENASKKLNAPLKNAKITHHHQSNALANEPKILAIITCTGYCVCYRPNGHPRCVGK